MGLSGNERKRRIIWDEYFPTGDNRTMYDRLSQTKSDATALKTFSVIFFIKNNC